MDARDLQRYKRLLLTKLEELSAIRGKAESVVPGGGDRQGDVADQANSDTEAEVQIRLHQTDGRLLRAIEQHLLQRQHALDDRQDLALGVQPALEAGRRPIVSQEFVDELAIAVQVRCREALFELTEGLRDSGMAILYTTHYMEEAERLCDRIAIMDEGEIVAQGTLDDLLTLRTAEPVRAERPHGLAEVFLQLTGKQYRD